MNCADRSYLCLPYCSIFWEVIGEIVDIFWGNELTLFGDVIDGCWTDKLAELFETWHELASAGQFGGQGDQHTLKPYVRQAFRKYLECGIFAHGFAWAWCDGCGHDYFVAFSCKGRGVCPSCNTRRMVETAAHLTDHVFPRLPVRQWVLSAPKRLRYLMRRDGGVLNMVLRIFFRVIAQSLQTHSPGAAQVYANSVQLHVTPSMSKPCEMRGPSDFFACTIKNYIEFL